MKVIKTEYKLCLSCMEEHAVDFVQINDKRSFKGENVEFTSVSEYCKNSEEVTETEEMIKMNDLALKDAYRKKVKLLTSEEIKNIREKYDVSQKDFSQILEWGMATVTRYENQQVQDRAHDDILRKIKEDPKWFLDLLERSKERLSQKAYLHYYEKAREVFKQKKNQYLIDSIGAIYADYNEKTMNGGMDLNLKKVVEVINYLAMKIENLHKVKLMKMLWFADILNFKRNGISITGLVYRALPLGAVPEAHEQIILLDGVCFESIVYGDNIGYKFRAIKEFAVRELNEEEIQVVDEIIHKLGKLSTKEIVEVMHEEDAYKYTQSNGIISYEYAEQLSFS
jgi:putative zinc finger/helix-turn-helix YgiT family protein